MCYIADGFEHVARFLEALVSNGIFLIFMYALYNQYSVLLYKWVDRCNQSKFTPGYELIQYALLTFYKEKPLS